MSCKDATIKASNTITQSGSTVVSNLISEFYSDYKNAKTKKAELDEEISKLEKQRSCVVLPDFKKRVYLPIAEEMLKHYPDGSTYRLLPGIHAGYYLYIFVGGDKSNHDNMRYLAFTNFGGSGVKIVDFEHPMIETTSTGKVLRYKSIALPETVKGLVDAAEKFHEYQLENNFFEDDTNNKHLW